MPYWNRPRFWLLLLLVEIGAFLFSALVATGVAIIFIALGMHEHHMGIVIEILGPLINAILGYSAFFYVRNRAAFWPQPRQHGFPVILPADEKTG